jgi:tetratricopeptide (TPR) repeat protein
VLRDTLNRFKQRGETNAGNHDATREQAIAALDRGELEVGRRELLQSLKYGSDSFETMTDIAAELALAGFRDDAEHVLHRTLERFPNRVEVKIELARLFLESGNDNKAQQVATQALREHPDNNDLHALAAAADEQLGLLGDAANHWAAILATDPNHSYSNLRLASLLERMGDAAGAIRCLRRLVEVTGGRDLEAVTSLGIALSADGQHGEAVALLAEVAKEDPDLGSAHADLANALLAAGRVEDAIAGFSEALRLDPDSAQAYCGLGLAYQSIHRWYEAAEAFRITERLAPDQAVGPYNLGLALSALGEPDEARSALLRAAALEPADVGIREAVEGLRLDAPVADPVVPAPRFGGDIETFALAEVLEFLRLQKKTGSLVIASRRGAAIVRLARGRVTSASAPGVSRSGETTRAVFQQIVDALGEMLTWKEGAFSFHPGTDGAAPANAFDLQNVMLQIMRGPDDRHAEDPTT